MHVLVVEDNPDTRDLLHQALTNEGHEVSQARGVTDALRLSDMHPDIDIVVVDINSTHQNSVVQIAQQMRRSLRHGKYVLASGDWDAIEPFCQRDTIVLRKPYGKNDLLRAVDRCIDRMDYTEQVRRRA
ncbi:response regulator [Dyella sp. 2HG41-7]|uniref:response regulator n=1 Tax=Dyella sp. 2HG41-7 TaxID=2883239 RepID=UPI001F241FD8|nr:response regulator [Dyella sp. 2HG41-7]